MKHQLIFPMAAYVFYTFALALHMFRTRVNAVKSGTVSVKYYKSQTGPPPPERVIVIARHYDNQFQLPILFFITCLAHIVMGSANPLTLSLAWGFVLSRAWHSWILLGKNRVLKRAAVFGLGWLFIVGLWIQLVCAAI